MSETVPFEVQKAMVEEMRDEANLLVLKADALRVALNLYTYALEAHAAGNRLAVLDADDTIVAEMVGFGRPTDAKEKGGGKHE